MTLDILIAFVFFGVIFVLGLCNAASLGDQMGAEARRQLEDREVEALEAIPVMPFDPEKLR